MFKTESEKQRERRQGEESPGCLNEESDKYYISPTISMDKNHQKQPF